MQECYKLQIALPNYDHINLVLQPNSSILIKALVYAQHREFI